jgi:mercuric ion binding protein
MRLVRTIMLLALLPQPAIAAERSAQLAIANMSCALCPITVKSAISRVPGVIAVEVKTDPGEAIVTYDDMQTNADVIAAASTNAGYPATEVAKP